MQVEDKVVLLSGASTGIGLATAHLFARQGAKLALVARSADKIQKLAEQLPGSIAIPADLSELDSVPAVIEKAAAHFGRIDVLINNAGRAMHVPFEKADIELYRSLLDLNVVSVLRAMQAVIPMMRRQGGGVIVNISSGLSKRIVAGVGPYASSKYALNALSLTARLELEEDNIRVCLVYPGRTAGTHFGMNALSAENQTESWRAGLEGDTTEHVALKVLEAVQTEAAETFADSIRHSMK